jgi:ATP-binding cassette subfamily B protein
MRIFKYLKKYWFFAILAPLFMVGEVWMDLLQPQKMADIVNIGLDIENPNLEFIIVTGLQMLGLVLIGGVMGILSGVFTNLAAFKYSNDMRKDVFSHIANLSFEQTNDFTTGSLVTRVANDVMQVTNIVSMSMRMMIRTLMQFVMGIYFLLKLNKEFMPVLFVALPILLVMIVIFIVKIAPLFSEVQVKVDDVNAVVQENVTGSRVVKAYTAEYKEIKRFKKANDNLYNTNWRISKLMSYLMPFVNLVFCAAMIAIIYMGGYNITHVGNMKVGDLTAAISYITIILNGFMMLAMFFQNIVRGIASIKRLNAVLDCKPVVQEGTIDLDTEILDENGEPVILETGTLEFKDVTFSYPDSSGEVVLSNINLKINKGEKIGVLGSTGCGKSTLVKLIARFYDTTSGNVYIDGIDVKDYKFSALRNKVAVVLQKSELFSGTIKDNICWGKEDATMEEVEYAAKIAQADTFINGFVDKYDTYVAEKGASLSGGQKQRISIARALIKKPEILVFDDSTSALDLQTEAKLYQAINNDLKDLTIITIAQRVASVKNADKIVVFNDGTITDIGTHEELIKNSPTYIDIYNSQLKKAGDE